MTVTAFPVRDEYTGTASQTVFNYTFKIYTDQDLDVYITPVGQEANDSADITTAYTVDPSTIGDDGGGVITLNTGVDSGDLVTIVSSITENRTTDYQNSGDFLPDTVNGDFDKAYSLILQSLDRAFRTLAFPESRQNVVALTLPLPDATLFLRWRSDELGLENVDLATSGAPTLASLVTYDTKGVDVNFELDFLNSKSAPKNVLINGAMDIWQREVIFTGALSGVLTADRWIADLVNISGSGTVKRKDLDVPELELNRSSYYLEFEQLVAASGSTTILQQRVESAKTLAGSDITISFWARSPESKTFEIQLQQNFGVGGSPSSPNTQTFGNVTLTTSWAKYTTTGTLDPVEGKTFGTNNNDSLIFRIRNSVLDTYGVDITNVQLEQGSVATDFEYKNPVDELTTCQRFYAKSYNSDVFPGANTTLGRFSSRALTTAAVAHRGFVALPLPMRIQPTISIFATDGTPDNADLGIVEYAASGTSVGEAGFTGELDATQTAVSANDTYSFHWTAEAEL